MRRFARKSCTHSSPLAPQPAEEGSSRSLRHTWGLCELVVPGRERWCRDLRSGRGLQDTRWRRTGEVDHPGRGPASTQSMGKDTSPQEARLTKACANETRRLNRNSDPLDTRSNRRSLSASSLPLTVHTSDAMGVELILARLEGRCRQSKIRGTSAIFISVVLTVP
jgi:hypothetical protein